MNKIEKIIVELGRKISIAFQHSNTYWMGKLDAYKEVLDFTKSLVDEPINEDLNTAAKEYADNITEKVGYKLQLRRAVVYGAKWQKKKASSIVKQYADKGEKNYQDNINDVYEDEMASSYWDGFRDCANGILRELKDE